MLRLLRRIFCRHGEYKVHSRTFSMLDSTTAQYTGIRVCSKCGKVEKFKIMC